MADFKINRIKFRWRGEWTPSINYIKDDIVYYQGKAFVCLAGHEAGSVFYDDFEANRTETKTITVSTDTLLGNVQGKFYLDGIENPELFLIKGRTYIFNQDSSSNVSFNSSENPFLLSLTKNGELNGGGIYGVGVTYFLDSLEVSANDYKTNFDSATTREVRWTVPSSAPDKIFYYSPNNLDLGNSFNLKYNSYWELMFDGYTWNGDWNTNTFYAEGSIVKWKSYLYVSIADHTSNSSAISGLPADIANWNLYAQGYNWLNVWATSTHYNLGDVVRYNGRIYLCIEKHQSNSSSSAGLELDFNKWNVITRSDNWTTDWSTSVRYIVDDIVKYGANVYRCINAHTSAATNELGLENNISDWQVVNLGIEYKGNYNTGVRYKLNDVVKYGAVLWKCTLGYTSATNLRLESANWELWIPGLEYERLWDNTVEYQIGDIVLYGGYAYIALQNNLNSVPNANGLLQDLGDWEILKTGYNFRNDYSDIIQYYVGDVVRQNGYLYAAIADNIGQQPDINTNSWQVLITGSEFRAEWNDNTTYYLGDIVTYLGTAYVCIDRHISTSSASRPDIDLQQPEQDYWIKLIEGAPNNVLAEIGDIKTFDTDNIRLPLGTPGKVLKSVSSLPSWENFEVTPKVFYVSVEGTDAVGFGTQLSAPFRTIKYACDYIRTNESIYKFNDTNYDNKPLEDAYMLSLAITRRVSNTLISTAPNFNTFLNSTNSRTNRAYGDIDASGVIASLDAAIALSNQAGSVSPTSTNATNLAILDIINYVNENSNDFVNEYVLLDSNQIPIVKTTYPNTTIFIKTGFYQEILPIRIPQNCALVGDELRSTTVTPAAGYETSNMFYVNNGCGIRNMTLQGLSGSLGAPNQYLTRRPTAGAFVSLDPGSGPNDINAWITTKSPYVQNVTTFGTGCTGMKIDGSLHNGGNDSVVANDFTQVLSDGIGYWATDLGRSELVSVFTYYCHIGYLAENGGVLRGTNGNNSYGTYGSVAEGFNQAEVAITGTVNNRTREATVGEIITFGTNEQIILALGYTHPGQSYSSAGITFNGSGFGASGNFTEFRNNAISELRVTDPGDSSQAGGFNYTFVAGSAQSGSQTSIVISQSDLGSSAEYVGQRIIIISGKGVGQYAYISGYNSSTKQAIISRESDDAAGWDHLQPGWPIEDTLDSTTRYVIEPRVLVSEPEYTDSAVTGPSNDNWKFIKYGEGKWVAVSEGGSGDAYATYSANGSSWNDRLSLGSGFYISDLVYTGSKFLAVREQTFANTNASTILQSANGETWGTVNLGFSNKWTGIASNGLGNVILVSGFGSSQVLQSSNDGDSWSSVSLGTINKNWGPAAYGNGKFVILDSAEGSVAYSTNNGSSWTIISPLTPYTWVSITYGNGRFVALAEPSVDSTGNRTKAAYSFDGITWYESQIDQGDFTRVSYGAGVFLATGTGNLIAKSADGKIWRTFDEDSTSFTTTEVGNWENSAYADGKWIVVQNGSNSWNSIETGNRAVIRAKVASTRITEFAIYDPGSNYIADPTILVFDNSNTKDTTFVVRKNNGVLAQPEMTNRGTGYFTATATITGNGFADQYQLGFTLNVSNATDLPGPGANLSIDGINEVNYRITRVNSFTGTGPYNFNLQITPSLDRAESPDHGTNITIRQQYSQIRLTGHDFLDIGTGNFNDTNYPNLYLFGEEAINSRQPFNEVIESGGGRVFYTSTDQDGNFKVGSLFKVEQNTGIVTIDASQFDLTGLEELVLGGIQVGGTPVVIREFSKEPTFVANSNFIVPTQKAIASFVASRISGGGSNATTNTLISGQVRVTSNEISTTSGLQINVPVKLNMKQGIDGHYLAMQYYAFGGAFDSGN